MTDERPHLSRAKERFAQRRFGPDYEAFTEMVKMLADSHDPYAVVHGYIEDILTDEQTDEISNELKLEPIEFEGVAGDDDYAIVVSANDARTLTQEELTRRITEWIEENGLLLEVSSPVVSVSMER